MFRASRCRRRHEPASMSPLTSPFAVLSISFTFRYLRKLAVLTKSSKVNSYHKLATTINIFLTLSSSNFITKITEFAVVVAACNHEHASDRSFAEALPSCFQLSHSKSTMDLPLHVRSTLLLGDVSDALSYRNTVGSSLASRLDMAHQCQGYFVL
jgi:hypothetical protein